MRRFFLTFAFATTLLVLGLQGTAKADFSWYWEDTLLYARDIARCPDGKLFALNNDGSFWWTTKDDTQWYGLDFHWGEAEKILWGAAVQIACGKTMWVYTSERYLLKNVGSETDLNFEYVGNPYAAKQIAVQGVGHYSQVQDYVWALNDDGGLYVSESPGEPGSDSSWAFVETQPDGDRIAGVLGQVVPSLLMLKTNKDLLIGQLRPTASEIDWTLRTNLGDASEITEYDPFKNPAEMWALNLDQTLQLGLDIFPPPPPSPPSGLGPLPSNGGGWQLAVPQGLSTCTPDLSDCSFFPQQFDQFVLVWNVCNVGTRTSPAGASWIVEALDGNTEETYSVALPAIAANQCVQQQTGQLYAWTRGFWDWDLFIGGVSYGNVGQYFFN